MGRAICIPASERGVYARKQRINMQIAKGSCRSQHAIPKEAGQMQDDAGNAARERKASEWLRETEKRTVLLVQVVLAQALCKQ